MKAIILSAGEGTRMQPLTITRPKTMLPVAGKPMMQYNIKYLKEMGITDILIVVGYKKEEVMDYFKDGSKFGVNIEYVTQEEQLGTAHAIGFGKDFVDDSVLILNGDIIIDSDLLKDIVDFYEESDHDTLMVLTEVEDPRPYGVVGIENEQVIKIVEKPNTIEEAPSNLINTGIYIFNKDIFEKIDNTPKSQRGEYEITDSLTLQIEDQMNIGGFITDKKWIDVGRPWELLDINSHVVENIENKIRGKIEDNVKIHGNIKLGRGSIIRSGCYIKGNVVIGDNCDIGPNTYLRGNTSIGNNVHIGNAVEVKNSIIMDGTNVGHLSYVGDSIIGKKCNFGAGTNIANLRFDDATVPMTVKGERVDTGRRKLGSVFADRVKTGVNSCFNPGVIVGYGSFIGSGVILSQDRVDDYSLVVEKQNHKIYDIKKLYEEETRISSKKLSNKEK